MAEIKCLLGGTRNERGEKMKKNQRVAGDESNVPVGPRQGVEEMKKGVLFAP